MAHLFQNGIFDHTYEHLEMKVRTTKRHSINVTGRSRWKEKIVPKLDKELLDLSFADTEEATVRSSLKKIHKMDFNCGQWLGLGQCL